MSDTSRKGSDAMDIKTYWNERAATDKPNATTNDVYLRELERNTLIEQLRALGCSRRSRVLDAGCGDGETILAVSEAFGCVGVGRDYSASMIDLAREKAGAMPNVQVDLGVADVRSIDTQFDAGSFDFVMTDRCLINLESSEDQYAAIGVLARLLRPGGRYLAIENFVEGNARLNELRAVYELPPIEIRWHNHFFVEADFRTHVASHFSHVEKHDFSSAYYLATRVIYSKLCAVEGVAPDYRHPIHAASTKLPPIGDFSPIKLFVLTK